MSSTMGWKATSGAVVGVLIAFTTGAFRTEVEAFFDLLSPNAGFYIVRIVYGVAAFYVLAVLGHMVYVRWFKRFKAEIVGKKPFVLGGMVGFKASYRGKLENGLFTCRVLPPKGTVLPTKEKTHEWWPCYGTFRHIENRDVGILRGHESPWEFAWEARIPENFPEGEYMAFIGVYESTDSGNEPVKEKQFSFLILNPKNVFRGSPGVSDVLEGDSPSGLHFV